MEWNDESPGAYGYDDANNNNNNVNLINHINFETLMIKSSLYDYNDADLFVKGTIKVPNTAADGVAVNHSKRSNI